MNAIPISSNHLRIVPRTLALLALCVAPWLEAAEPLKIGDKAPDFALKTLDNQTVRFRELTAKGNVALVVLRGWPGYQCPLCERQVNDLVENAAKLRERNVQMIFVYPGPADQLKAHASEFLKSKAWPNEFLFVIDPDFEFTVSYGLRWSAPHETAYPSTFIVGGDDKVRFAHVSKGHGDRLSGSDLIKQLDALK